MDLMLLLMSNGQKADVDQKILFITVNVVDTTNECDEGVEYIKIIFSIL